MWRHLLCSSEIIKQQNVCSSAIDGSLAIKYTKINKNLNEKGVLFGNTK